MSIRSKIFAAAAVAATLGFGATAAPAFAQQPQSIIVSYADLNLASRAGRDVLDARITRAASRLCGEFGPLELTWSAEAEACQDETIAAVQPQRDAAIGQLRGTVRISSAGGYLNVSRAAN